MLNRLVTSDNPTLISKTNDIGLKAFSDEAEAGTLSLFEDREGFTMAVVWDNDIWPVWEVWYFHNKYQY